LILKNYFIFPFISNGTSAEFLFISNQVADLIWLEMKRLFCKKFNKKIDFIRKKILSLKFDVIKV